MKLTRLIVTMTATLLASQVLAGASLAPHKAEYKVRISVLSGRLNTELRRTADGYVANHIIKPTGISRLFAHGKIDVTSEFAIAADGIKPVRFRAIDTISDDPDVDLRFNWTTNEAVGTVGEDDVVLQLDGIAYDSVSIQYELMHDLLNGGASEQYVLFDIDKMRVANVTNVGSKQVRTKAGKFMAIGIRHQKEGSSRVTTLWCVEELGFLPVIIEQHRKGKLNFRATLLTYTPTDGQGASTQ